MFFSSISSLIGIFIGHFYYFLKFQYPQELGGNAFLETPFILWEFSYLSIFPIFIDFHFEFLSKQYVPDVSGGISYFGVPPASRAEQRPGGAAPATGIWGRGNSLGR